MFLKCPRRGPGCCSCPGGAGRASTGGHESLPTIFSSAPSALGPSACKKVLPALAWGPSTHQISSLCPTQKGGLVIWRLSTTPGHPPPQPPPNASPSGSRLHGSHPPERAARGGPQPPGPHPGSSWELAQGVPVLGLGWPGWPHLVSGQQGRERGQAGSGKLGWWAQGEGYKWPPQAGPLLRKGMEPSSDQWGHRGLPTCPGRPARPSRVLSSRPRSLGGGGC